MIKKNATLLIIIVMIFSIFLVGCDPVVDDKTEDVDSDIIDVSFIPDGKDYDSYKSNVDLKSPVSKEIFGCDVSDESCLESKTNTKDEIFGTEVVVKVPKGYMDKNLDLTPKVTKNSNGDAVLYEFEFAHSDFDGFVEIEFDWPSDLDSNEYVISHFKDGDEFSQDVYVKDGKAYFYTNHFSLWTVAKRFFSDTEETKEKISVTLEEKSSTGRVLPIKNTYYELQLDGDVIYKGKTNNQGKLTAEILNSVNKDNINVVIYAQNGMINVRNNDGVIYSSLADLKEDNGAYKANFEIEDTTAFKILKQSQKVKDFWLDKYSGKVNTRFLYIPLDVYYPYSDGTYFGTTKSKIYENVYIGIKDQDTQSLVMNDGNGDTFVHEYTHYLTWYFYGWSNWGRLVTSNAHHAPGSLVATSGDALKEDIAYFVESVFDGKKLKDLDSADFRTKISRVYKSWETSKTKYASITDKQEKSKQLEKIKKVYETQTEFLDSMNKDISKYDGIAGNVFYSLYEQNGEDEFSRIMNIFITEKPISLDEFAVTYRQRFGEEKFKILNATMWEYGYRDFEELDKFWDVECMSANDPACDDGNPCTSDYCMDAAKCSGNECGSAETCYKPGDCEKPKCMHLKQVVNPFDGPYGDGPDYTVKTMYTPVDMPEECKNNDDKYDYCGTLCCDAGETNYPLRSLSNRVEATTNCYGFGNGNPCLSKNEGFLNYCCTDSDCKESDNNKNTYETFARSQGYDNAKCVDNYCVYVNVLPMEAVTSCTTNQYDYTSCYYTLPEN